MSTKVTNIDDFDIVKWLHHRAQIELGLAGNMERCGNDFFQFRKKRGERLQEAAELIRSLRKEINDLKKDNSPTAV